MARPLIIDCDPGTDDAIALLMAMAHPELFHILGITTVGGNVPLALVTENALKICELAGRRDIPVHAGCGRPLVKSNLMTAEYVHGVSGLGSATLPPSTLKMEKKHGVDFIIDAINASPEKVTLAPIGPLTNIAMALVKSPSIRENIEEIVFMGGAMHGGNVPGGYAEFNIFNDPHAAHVVFTSGLKVTMIGLDVTHAVLLTQDRLDRITALKTPVSKFVTDMLASTIAVEREHYGLSGCIIHDACVIGYLMNPSLFVGKKCPAFVEIHSASTMGQTVVDWHNWSKSPENLHVLSSADSELFFEGLYSTLSRYS